MRSAVRTQGKVHGVAVHHVWPWSEPMSAERKIERTARSPPLLAVSSSSDRPAPSETEASAPSGPRSSAADARGDGASPSAPPSQ